MSSRDYCLKIPNTMSKEFDVNSKVNLPHITVEKTIDGYHIVIAPDKPNWIVLDDQEYEIFRILSKIPDLLTLNLLLEFFLNLVWRSPLILVP